MGDGLGQLALRDRSAGDEHVDLEAHTGGIGGGGGAGVAGGGAENGLVPVFDGFGDGEDHTAVFEGAGGVAGLQLEMDGGGAGESLQ